MSRTRAVVAIWLLVGICLLGIAGGATAVGASDHDSNDGTQHKHPDDVGSDGNLTAVQGWLGDRMTEIHINCAQNVTLTDSVACDRLDGDYPEYLSEYASVEQDRTGETETADTFEETRNQQAELVDEYREFNETYEEYQEAREAGDEERAQELARELQDRSERIAELGRSLDIRFIRLEELTGRDYGPARNGTDEVLSLVINTTTEVEGEVFTRTTLTAEIDAESATFRDPATVTGRLTDENGTRLADREIVIIAGNRTVTTTRTDEEGTYEASYRPVTATTGSTTVQAVYEPVPEEVYLGSDASAEVNVEAVDPEVDIETDADRVAFGDTVTVTADVSADDVAAPSVPVAVFLGGERIAKGETGSDGRVEIEGTVPAMVPDGERELRVRASRESTALSPVSESRTVTVLETETELTIEGLLDGDTLVLSGRLTTVDGQPVTGQRVGVNVDGEVRRTSLTNTEGRYEVEVPRDTGPGGEWSVSADYNNPQSNLAPTTTTRTLRAENLNTTAGTTVEREGLVGQSVSVVENNRIPAAILAVLVGLALGGAIGKRYFDQEEGEIDDGETVTVVDDGPDGEATSDETPGEDSVVDEPSVSDSGGEDPLTVARNYLESGSPSEAVRIGYGAVRNELLRRTGGEERDTRTHWEFYHDVRSELPDSGSEALETLTDAYERAAFAPSGVDESTAQTAVDAAEECLQESPAGDSAATDGGIGDER